MRLYLLLPDGVGIRNFIYTDFLQTKPVNSEVTIWTEKPLADLLKKDLSDVRIEILPQFQTTSKIEVLRKAKQTAELLRNAKKFKNSVYKTYLFPYKLNNPRQWIKWAWEKWLLLGNINDQGVRKLKSLYLYEVRKTEYYEKCKKRLQNDKPDLIFCTHQRAPVAIAPLLAAIDLGIPTATFIFSWDNLPKGTLTVEADHFIVWSDYMKSEMLKYYPEISKEKIHVAGTPQFVPYFDDINKKNREAFCAEYGLNPSDRFICFSGDDVTTSPHDPVYLSHLAEAVRTLNSYGGKKYSIIFRRCPADWSDRYNKVLSEHSDVIHSIDPIWKSYEGNRAWNHFIPDKKDVELLVNTVLHCDLVVNVGSTMAIDFATLGKPACYIRYDAVKDKNWSTKKIYDFIHFQTIQGLDPVYWIDSREDWNHVLPHALSDRNNKVPDARKWQQKIAKHPLEEANFRIWNAIISLYNNAHLLSDRRVSAS